MARDAATQESLSKANHNRHLLPEVRDRVADLDEDTCHAWGGAWWNDTCHVRPLPLDENHTDTTIVRSADEALDAFERYTDYFEYVLNCVMRPEATKDSAVLLPCGSTKPIGTSAIHRKKVAALKQADFYPRCDIVIISEPCTVVPHHMRLSMPAVNYDFPPKYTEPNVAPEVFDLFTDRLARWIDESGYETLYPYLVAGHQEKLDAALDKCERDPRIVNIPGASANVEKLVTDEDAAFSGDLMKSTEDVATKLEFVRALNDCGDESLVGEYPDVVREFYENRPEYGT